MSGFLVSSFRFRLGNKKLLDTLLRGYSGPPVSRVAPKARSEGLKTRHSEPRALYAICHRPSARGAAVVSSLFFLAWLLHGTFRQRFGAYPTVLRDVDHHRVGAFIFLFEETGGRRLRTIEAMLCA